MGRLQVHIVDTPALGDRSYVVTDGEVAAVIDPQRDIDRILDAAAGVPITHVFETHLHNDYVSGGRALAKRAGAEYVVHVADDVAFDRVPIAAGESVTTGSLVFTAIATPGHTPTHLAHALSCSGEYVAVFTGGSMLFGAMGRTDLIDPAVTEELTRAQYRSAHALASLLPESTEIYPTHGFGSFCSATETKGDQSTIGKEKEQNNALTLDEDSFVTELVEGLTAYPRYYAHMGPANRVGAGEPDLSMPAPVEPAELRRRIEAGEWVVDLRDRSSFAARHVPGTLSIELADAFATYLGWTIQWGTPLTLIGDSEDQVLQARRQLVRIGIDELRGAATGSVDDLAAGQPLGAYPRATFADLAKATDVTVLDVRRPDEWRDGHIEHAVHVPFYDLEGREHEVPGEEVWVHCKSGYRASIAASLLDRAGRRVVHIDDEWTNAESAGNKITR